MATQSALATRRQLIDDARRTALDGNWEEVIAVNQQLIEKSPKDAEAFNRIGRAQLALGKLSEAREAYQTALRADPANLIARRNLQRLEALTRRDAALRDAGAISMPRTNVFIEEVGKTWVDELVNPAPSEELAEVFPGEKVTLVIEENKLVVKRLDGRRLGEIEAKTADRVIALIGSGNRYDVYALGISGASLRVILREVFRDPRNGTQVSFPRQILSRAYLRERDLLRARDEADFFMLDDDDDVEDETTNADGDDDEPVDSDNDTFSEDTVTVVEDEESTL